MQRRGGPGQRVDLTNCAVEPIHIPGRIQPHGALLALSPGDLVIRHVSRNVGALLGSGPEGLVGRSLLEVVAPAAGGDLESILRSPDPAAMNPLKVSPRAGGAAAWFDAIAHRAGERLIVELEPAGTPGDMSFSSVYRVTRATLGQVFWLRTGRGGGGRPGRRGRP